MSRKKWGKKSDWPCVSARVDPLDKEKLEKKHPNDGEVSIVLRALIKKYLDGKIIGLQLET